MSKGLEQLLARILENPTRMMIDRYLSLLVDLSEDEGKTSRALDLAEGLIGVDSLQALRIAFMVHQTNPDDLRAYDLMIEGLTNRGRHAKAEVLRLERSRLAAVRSPAPGRLAVASGASEQGPADHLEPAYELSEVSLRSAPSELSSFLEAQVMKATAYAKEAFQPVHAGVADLQQETNAPAWAEPDSYAGADASGAVADPGPLQPEAATYAPELFEWQKSAAAAASAGPQSPRLSLGDGQLGGAQSANAAESPKPTAVSITRLLEIGGFGAPTPGGELAGFSAPAPAAASPLAQPLDTALPARADSLLEAPADKGNEQPLFQLKTSSLPVQPAGLRATVATPLGGTPAARLKQAKDAEPAADFSDELVSFAVQPAAGGDAFFKPAQAAGKALAQADGAAFTAMLPVEPSPSPQAGAANYTATAGGGISLDLFGPSALHPAPDFMPAQVGSQLPAEAKIQLATQSLSGGQKTTVLTSGPKRQEAPAASTAETGPAAAEAKAVAAKATAVLATAPAGAKPERKSIDFATTPHTKLAEPKTTAASTSVKPVPASGLAQFWSTLVSDFGHLEAKPVDARAWAQPPGKPRRPQLEPLPEGFWRALAATAQKQLTETDRGQNLQILAEILTAELDESSASAFAALSTHLQLNQENPLFWGLYLDTLLLRRRHRQALVEVRTLLSQRPQPGWAAAAWARLPRIWQGLAVHGFDWREEAGVMALIKGLERRPKAKSWGMVV